MKKRMLLMTTALFAALCTAAAALVPAALADGGEAEARARQARVEGYLAAQFGEGWENMPRPRTLTLVPADREGNEYSEATMRFNLDD